MNKSLTTRKDVSSTVQLNSTNMMLPDYECVPCCRLTFYEVAIAEDSFIIDLDHSKLVISVDGKYNKGLSSC